MRRQFTYPKDLIPSIQEAWVRGDFFNEQVPDFPPVGYVEEFLELAYQASMLKEEARQIDFRLAFISPELADQLAGPAIFGRLYEPVVFNERRDFTVSEIHRLAPATDHNKVLICVSPLPDPKNPDEEYLQIWGLINTGSSWWEFSQMESRTGVPPPDCLAVSSDKPGTLIVSKQGSVLLSLRNGALVQSTSQTLYEGPIAEFLENARLAMYKEAGCVEDESEDNSISHDENIQTYYFRFIERILVQIRELSHGGALLVVPHGMESDDQLLSKLVRIKYPCHYNQPWSFHIDSLALKIKYQKMFREIYKGVSQINVGKFHELTQIESKKEEVDKRITDAVHMYASASCVDGAVLITDQYELIGFGSEITALSPGLNIVHTALDHLATETVEVPIESYGTRHRSAFRFCWSNPDSIAFVISQDGGLKGVRRVGDKLIFWPDINFGPLGV